MSRPEDIPQDVWDAAEQVGDLIPSGEGDTVTVCVGDIARAILAAKAQEREACAHVVIAAATRHRVKQADAMEADQPESHLLHALYANKLDEVAAAIRKRGEA